MIDADTEEGDCSFNKYIPLKKVVAGVDRSYNANEEDNKLICEEKYGSTCKFVSGLRERMRAVSIRGCEHLHEKKTDAQKSVLADRTTFSVKKHKNSHFKQ